MSWAVLPPQNCLIRITTVFFATICQTISRFCDIAFVMADSRHTPEIINAALGPDERIQYRSLLNLLLDNKVLNTQQQAKYDGYKEKIEAYIKKQSDPEISDKELDPSDPNEVGIPSNLRVKRRYTMSPEALAQRQDAAHSPSKSSSMEGNRNGWKHGKYVENFVNKIKPCKSTCSQYPCSLVQEGDTKPGDDCLDKADIISFYRAVHKAIANKDLEDFNSLAALQISNAMKVVDMLIEDIIRDGTVVKREKHDAKDNLIIEYVTHPSLLALPKLVADLGLNPAEFMITPRAITRDEEKEKDRETVTDGFTRIAKAMGKIKSPKRRNTDDGD